MSNGSCAFSCGSKPTFRSCGGKPGTVAPSGAACARAAAAQSSSVATDAISQQTNFIFPVPFSLLGRHLRYSLNSSRRDNSQTLFRNDRHRFFDGNLRDARFLIAPGSFFERLEVLFHFVAQILLPIDVVVITGHAKRLETRLWRNNAGCALTHRRERRIEPRDARGRVAPDGPANEQNRDNRQCKIENELQHPPAPELAGFERNILVDGQARAVFRFVCVSAHGARWLPPTWDRPKAGVAVTSVD